MKKKIKVPPSALIDPALARAKMVAQEEEKRFNKIVERIIDILKEENVAIKEVSAILNMVDGKIAKEIGSKSLNSIYGRET